MSKYYSVVESGPVKITRLCFPVGRIVRVLCRGCALRDVCSVYLAWEEEAEKVEA